MPPSFELTIHDAVSRFAVSRKTLRRLLDDDAIAGAQRRSGPNGPEWVFPASSLEQLGYRTREGIAGPAGTPAPRRTVPRPPLLAALVALVLLLVAGGVAISGGADDAAAPAEDQPITQLLLRRTAPGDRVGASGTTAASLVPEDRRVIRVDATTDEELLPRYVVLDGVATSALRDRLRGSAVVLDLVDEGVSIVDRGEEAIRDDAIRDDAIPDEVAQADVDQTDGPTEESTEESAGVGGSEGGEASGRDTDPDSDDDSGVDEESTGPDGGSDAPDTSDAGPDGPRDGSGAPAPGEEVIDAPDDAPTSTTDADDPVPSTPAPGETVTLVDGDSFWSIAAAVVLADDPGADDAAVAGYWQQLIDANQDGLVEPGNPDLLLVGQQLVLPSLSGAPPGG